MPYKVPCDKAISKMNAGIDLYLRAKGKILLLGMHMKLILKELFVVESRNLLSELLDNQTIQ